MQCVNCINIQWYIYIYIYKFKLCKYDIIRKDNNIYLINYIKLTQVELISCI